MNGYQVTVIKRPLNGLSYESCYVVNGLRYQTEFNGSPTDGYNPLRDALTRVKAVTRTTLFNPAQSSDEQGLTDGTLFLLRIELL